MRALLLAAAFAALPAVAQPAGPAVSEAELLRRLSGTLDSLAAAGAFSGVAALARGGEVVFAQAYGYADRAARRPNTVETQFNLGSINKVFTAIAIRQLEAEGRLHRDSTLATYWPDYPNADVARRVTLAQLLQHRSGVGGDIFAAPPGGTRRDVRHNRDYLALITGAPLQFEPGTDQRYSNAGYVLLGEVVARVAGEDYYEYVRRHIYAPAGMAHTAHHPADALPAGAARGYTTRGETTDVPLHVNTETLPGMGSAAGGGYSTAADLLAFVQALREGRIPAGMPAGIGAAGGAPGINGVVEGELPGGYDLVVLANLDPPAAEEVSRRVRAWIGATD